MKHNLTTTRVKRNRFFALNHTALSGGGDNGSDPPPDDEGPDEGSATEPEYSDPDSEA